MSEAGASVHFRMPDGELACGINHVEPGVAHTASERPAEVSCGECRVALRIRVGVGARSAPANTPGPTGVFPGGKLNPEDKGELKLAVFVDSGNGKIVVEMGTPVRWFALDRAAAVQLIAMLQRKVDQLAANEQPRQLGTEQPPAAGIGGPADTIALRCLEEDPGRYLLALVVLVSNANGIGILDVAARESGLDEEERLLARALRGAMEHGLLDATRAVAEAGSMPCITVNPPGSKEGAS